tara:strand:+ start:662 stop:1261 length:600 start_codon:yes stop_codon:yes gene_type:complete
MPDHIKIGRTSNLSERLKSLDNTSVPLPFECLYAIEVDDPDTVERLLHDVFRDSRTRRSREFFEVGGERVIAAMNLTGGRDVTPREDIVEDQESQVALDKARSTHGAFNFDMVGIVAGTTLEFYDDPSITCVVKNAKQVEFDGEETSLSRSASKVLIGRLQDSSEIVPGYLISNAIRGPIYWYFEGESLSQRRKRMESE